MNGAAAWAKIALVVAIFVGVGLLLASRQRYKRVAAYWWRMPQRTRIIFAGFVVLTIGLVGFWYKTGR